MRQQCRLLGISPGGWLLRVVQAAADDRTSASFLAGGGPARICHPCRPLRAAATARLRREEHEVGRKRLRGWLSANGLRALSTRTSTRPPRTTQAYPQAIAAANKLATWPAAVAPNQIWVGDITYLGLATGQWAYLACWRDAFSRRVVGWHLSESLHTDLILIAFNRAVAICQPPPGLLVHVDRGSVHTNVLLVTWQHAMGLRK